MEAGVGVVLLLKMPLHLQGINSNIKFLVLEILM